MEAAISMLAKTSNVRFIIFSPYELSDIGALASSKAFTLGNEKG
jgi:hypothetical protein